METCNLHHQMMDTNPLEEVLICPNLPPPPAERKPRPQPEEPLRCPRCDSTNTKFCYYNNYSFSQPRYFCKRCRRYWTKGGTLRNVPVGGGCRKNKRSSSSSKKTQQDNQSLAAVSVGPLLTSLPPPPPPLVFDPNDFVLGNPRTNTVPVTPEAPSFLDILRSGFPDGGASAFDNLYYGFGGHGNVEEVEEVEVGATASTKQESSCKSADGDNMFLIGLQWHTAGDGNMLLDPGRDYWNGVDSSGWHGLVNSYII